MKNKITKQERQRRKRREARKTLACGIAFVVGMVVFTNLFIKTWVQELDMEAEHNRQFIEEVKAGK